MIWRFLTTESIKKPEYSLQSAAPSLATNKGDAATRIDSKQNNVGLWVLTREHASESFERVKRIRQRADKEVVVNPKQDKPHNHSATDASVHDSSGLY